MTDKNITNVIAELYEVINDRRQNPAEGSYTCYLFEKGIDKILKKVGEECSETIIAAKNANVSGNNDELTLEICDLLYHLLVLMNASDLPLEKITDELAERAKKTGNLKQFKTVDKNT
jgi:phosphoribosyl-ATP pyrophosphohydrolase